MANSLNKVQLIGNLTRDVELKDANGTAVADIGLATNSKWKDKEGNPQEKVEFHNITVWRGLADVCAKYLKKGSKVYFEGRLETQMWENDAKEKRYKTIVVADNMIMLGGKPEGTSDEALTAEAKNLPF